MRAFSVGASSLETKDSIELAFLFIAILAYVGVALWVWQKGRTERSENLKNTLRVVIVIVGSSLQPATGRITSIVQHAFEWVMQVLGLQLTQLLIAAAITAVGIGAHKFKQANKKWYGTVEVVVGFVSAVVVAKSLGPNTLDLAKWSTLAGCAYVIARGLGNRADAKKELAT